MNGSCNFICLIKYIKDRFFSNLLWSCGTLQIKSIFCSLVCKYCLWEDSHIKYSLVIFFKNQLPQHFEQIVTTGLHSLLKFAR